MFRHKYNIPVQSPVGFGITGWSSVLQISAIIVFVPDPGRKQSPCDLIPVPPGLKPFPCRTGDARSSFRLVYQMDHLLWIHLKASQGVHGQPWFCPGILPKQALLYQRCICVYRLLKSFFSRCNFLKWMNVAQNPLKKESLSVIGTDTPLSEDVLKQVREIPGVLNVCQVHL